MSCSSSTNQEVDESYLVLLSTSSETEEFDDENYAQNLHFQELLMSSIIPSQHLQLKIKEEPLNSSPINETFCKICAEHQPHSNMLSIADCTHSFCSECLTNYITIKIKENVTTISCPEVSCSSTLQPIVCANLVSNDVFIRWCDTLCEAMYGACSLYCPFSDCSELLVFDDEYDRNDIECSYCHRLFCRLCKTAWHSDMSCDERSKEGLLMKQIAEKKGWKRCPNCKFYVEKIQGCLHLTCRCRYEICYGCGEKWGITHASCSTA